METVTNPHVDPSIVENEATNTLSPSVDAISEVEGVPKAGEATRREPPLFLCVLH